MDRKNRYNIITSPASPISPDRASRYNIISGDLGNIQTVPSPKIQLSESVSSYSPFSNNYGLGELPVKPVVQPRKLDQFGLPESTISASPDWVPEAKPQDLKTAYENKWAREDAMNPKKETVFGKDTFYLKDVPDYTKQVMNHPAVSKAMTEVANRTSGTGVVSAIEAIGPKTFQQAYDANKAAQAGDPSKLNQFFYQLGDSIPQTALGVALNFIPYMGKPLSTAYWTALSASEQIDSKGKVTSLGNIGIDVIGDSMLGTSIESLFKAPAKTLTSTIIKNFGVEGGTEVAQDLLKMANNYRMAKTEEERNQILTDAKKYFTSGQILMTFGVGGISGAVIGTAAYTLNQTPSEDKKNQTSGSTPLFNPTVPPPPPGATPPSSSVQMNEVAEPSGSTKSFTFQDSNQEPLVHSIKQPIQTDLMNAGDLFRASTELGEGKDYAIGYFNEKFSKIERFLKNATEGNTHPDDSLSSFKNQDPQLFEQYQKAWETQPTATSLEEAVKTLNLALLKEDYVTAKSKLLEIKNLSTKKTIPVVPTVEKGPFVAGPGYQKFVENLEKMAVDGTLYPEDVSILKTLLQGTSDTYLRDLPAVLSNRLKGCILGHYTKQRRQGVFSHKITIKGRLAKDGHVAVQVFLHEFGHAGWYSVLTEEERQKVLAVYKSRGKKEVHEFFERGMKMNPGYHSKNVKEFFAQSFAEYLLENRVPAAQMEPLLKRLALKFYEKVKSLVLRRNEPITNRLRPIFEKALSGNKDTPLSSFIEADTPSTKAELQQIFKQGTPPPTPTTQPATPTQLFPGPGAQPKENRGIPPLKPVAKPVFKAPPEAPPFDSPTETPIDTMQTAFAGANQGLSPSEPPIVEPPEKVVTEQVRTPNRLKVGFLDKLRTPWRVLTRLGLRKNFQQLQKAYLAMTKEAKVNRQKIRDWMDSLPSESSENIFRSLDGENVQLTPEETKVKGEIKAWLAEWADRLGIPHDERISEYITHLFPLHSGVEIPEEIALLIRHKIPGEIYDPFLLQRKGAEGYLKDVWVALEAYTKRANRKVHMDPVLENLKKAVDEKLTEVSQVQYVEDFIHHVNMRPTQTDTELDNDIKKMVGGYFGDRPIRTITTWFRRMIARSKIGGSMVSLAKNLTQGVNTFAELGTRYTIRGYFDLVIKGRSAVKELEENGVLLDPVMEDQTYSAVRKWAERFDKVLFVNMNASELVNRGAAYYGAKKKYLDGNITPKEIKDAFNRDVKEGYEITMEDAIEYGRFVAGKTQFVFGALDTPVALNNDLMKTAFQFQTFGLKQQEFIIEMIHHKEWAKFTRYLLSSTMMFYFIGGAFGMKWTDTYPFFKLGIPPVVQFLMTLWDFGTQKEDKYGNTMDLGDLGASLVTNVVPMGTQIKRAVEGVGAVNAGQVRSKPSDSNQKGIFQYKVDQTPMNYVRGTLFGVPNLPETKTYYDKQKAKKDGKSKGREERYTIL